MSPKNGLSVVVKSLASLPRSQKTPMKLLAQSVPSILVVTARPKRRCEDLLAQSALLIWSENKWLDSPVLQQLGSCLEAAHPALAAVVHLIVVLYPTPAFV